MRFVLHYEGPLPSGFKGGLNSDKHAIRRYVHPQLRRQWEVDPTLAYMATQGPGAYTLATESVPFVRHVSVGGFTFQPLVRSDLHLACFLDITLERNEEPGGIIVSGDIDNQLKTLFDALCLPNEQQANGLNPADGETPLYTLLEDDALITGFQIRTERLLEVRPGRPKDVRLAIGVTVWPSHVEMNNLDFLGGFQR